MAVIQPKWILLMTLCLMFLNDAIRCDEGEPRQVRVLTLDGIGKLGDLYDMSTNTVLTGMYVLYPVMDKRNLSLICPFLLVPLGH